MRKTDVEFFKEYFNKSSEKKDVPPFISGVPMVVDNVKCDYLLFFFRQYHDWKGRRNTRKGWYERCLNGR